MEINIWICDDEKVFCDQLCEKVETIKGKIKISGNTKKFNSGKNLLEELDASGNNKPDMIFLDIEMPDMNGMDIAKSLYQKYPEIMLVFMTSYGSMMSQGFHVRAFRFLVKPAKVADIEETLVAGICELSKNRMIFIDSYGYSRKIIEKDIKYIVSIRNGVQIVTGVDKVEADYAMKKFLELLNEGDFFYLSRAAIISFRHIYQSDGKIVKMDDGAIFEIPKRRRKEFDEARAIYVMRNAR